MSMLADRTARSAEASGGAVAEDDLPVISFVEDVPGLPGLSRCVLVALDDDAHVFALRSIADPDLRLLVVAPGTVLP